MKEKLMNIAFMIGIILVFVTGTWGIIYEYVIWDKSFVPEIIFILTWVLGYIGIVLIILWYFWQKKKK